MKNFETLKQLNDSDLALARNELNEKDAEQIDQDIEIIRQWLLKQTYMKSRSDDAFILSFLRAAKFNYTRTQEMIKKFWLHRLETIEYFIGRNLNEDSVLLEIADTMFFVPLPQPDAQGRIVLIERITGWNPQKHDYNDLMKYILICQDVLCENPRVQINGVRQIYQFNCISIKNFSIGFLGSNNNGLYFF